MNDLEMVTSKICSAREILDCAIDAHEEHKHEKVEKLMYAVDEYLQYYLGEFDKKFKLAWKETVLKQKQEEDPCMPPWGHSDLEYLSKHKEHLSCDKDDPSLECKGAWNDFWEESPYPKEHSEYYYEYNRNDSNRKNPFNDKVKKWVLPVEETKDVDTDEIEYFISFPDDLLEATDLKEGDQVEWIDQGDGSYLLRKVIRPLGMDEC
jgi:hypothetical protein